MLSLFTVLRRSVRKVGLKPGQVALTFDDGPNDEERATKNVLDVLHRHSVKAGFCLVGKQVRRQKELVRRMFHSGHLLINHTQTHIHPLRQKSVELQREISQCDMEIGRALGQPDYQSDFFRAPFGIVTPAIRRVLKRRKMQHVLLTHYGWDTRLGPHNWQSMVDGLVEDAMEKEGGLFVLHDGSLVPPLIAEKDWNRSVENRSWVSEAVECIITRLKAKGFQFVLPGMKERQKVVLRKAA
ncbi:MAG: polysaccharide deacetylase family protein [Fuerstiella sp.]